MGIRSSILWMLVLLPGSLAIEKQQCKIEQWREKEKWIEKVERMQKELRERGFRRKISLI